MITIFNNTKTTWTIEPLRNNSMAKIKFTKKISDDKFKSFELITSTDINYDKDITKFKNMTEPVTVSNDNTELRFMKKTTAPMVVTNANAQYKKDFLLISVPMYGHVLKDIIAENAYVINYMIAKGELIMAVSVGGNPNDNFSFVLHNIETNIDTTYRFGKDADNKEFWFIKSVGSEPTEAIETPTFRIKKFRPSKPTYLICADIKDKSKLESIERIKPNNHEIIYAKDSVEAIKHLESKFANGYKSVTVFGAKKSFFGTYDELMDYVNGKFKIVNILKYDGGIIRK